MFFCFISTEARSTFLSTMDGRKFRGSRKKYLFSGMQHKTRHEACDRFCGQIAPPWTLKMVTVMDDMQKICLFLFCFKQIQLVHDMNPSGILVSFILYVTLKIVKTKTL